MEWCAKADGKRALHLEERKQSEKNERWGLHPSSRHTFIYVQQLQRDLELISPPLRHAAQRARMQDSQCKHNSNGPFRVFSWCLLIPLGVHFLKSASPWRKVGLTFWFLKKLNFLHFIIIFLVSSVPASLWSTILPISLQSPFLVCFIKLKLYL